MLAFTVSKAAHHSVNELKKAFGLQSQHTQTLDVDQSQISNITDRHTLNIYCYYIIHTNGNYIQNIIYLFMIQC